jgi:uncharacterized protein DUF2059
MYRVGLAAVLVAAMVCKAAAAPSAAPASQEDARKLLGLMRFEAQIDEAKRQCNDMVKTVTPESMYQSNPTQFGGITPESRLWPSVVHAFQQFYVDSCAYIDKEAFLDAAAASYAASLSRQDLTAAIEFYSSPVGKRVADAQAAGAAAFQREAAKRMAVSYKQANEEFSSRITDLVKGSRKQ